MSARRKPQFLRPIQPWRQRAWAALQHHGQSAGSSLKDWLRQPFSAVLTLLVVTASLLLPAILHWALNNVQQLTRSWQNTVEISVFLSPKQAEQQRASLQQMLTRPEVAGLEYLTPEQALVEFRQALGQDDILAALPDNPLPAVLRARLIPGQIEAEALQLLLTDLKNQPGVEQVKLDLGWLQLAQQLQQLGLHLVAGMMLFFALLMLLTVGNSIKLAIEQRKDEIEVLRLVGGTQSYIRRPFLYSGFWLGFVAGCLTWFGLWGLQSILQPAVTELARLRDSQFELLPLSLAEALVLVGVSSLLGVAGAWLAVGRHLYAIDIQQD